MSLRDWLTKHRADPAPVAVDEPYGSQQVELATREPTMRDVEKLPPLYTLLAIAVQHYSNGEFTITKEFFDGFGRAGVQVTRNDDDSVTVRTVRVSA